MPAFKPDGYSTVSPYLIVNGARGTIEFLRLVFSGVLVRHFDMPDGKIGHAEVKVGDSVIMLADHQPGWPSTPANVHIYVTDVDATFKLALEAGATSVQEPVKKDDDDKRGGVTDGGGTTWWISTKVV
jgi:uncharacterized glyoxalase superfamily protein PhnB